MSKQRLEAFTDGVIAILITIMVLDLHAPATGDLAALGSLVPTMASYLLSFIFLGIYWNSHHHLLHAAVRIDGTVLWANLHLLFWLSLVPLVTSWMGAHHDESGPTAVYGAVLLGAGVAFTFLQVRLRRLAGPDSVLARVSTGDRKARVSVALNVLAVGVAFVRPGAAQLLYLAGASLWFVPDRQVEREFG